MNQRQILLSKPTCPNCWNRFPAEQVKWVSGHEELVGDERLGADAQQRFTPSSFDIQCNAVDIRGISCQELACPLCHLKIPRSALESAPFFLSIVGTPSCGKSFFLASMAWQNRKTLPEKFGLSFSDADAQSNQLVNSYEERLFFSSGSDKLVQLPKTDVTGDNYSTVQYEDQAVTYPQPLFFDVSLTDEAIAKEGASKGKATGPVADQSAKASADVTSRLLCVYDNAGESFLPGADSIAVPVTRHLGLAEAWMYCFDPTQDPRFRSKLSGQSQDHQVVNGPVTARQDLVLTEMINRIRKFRNLDLKTRSDRPLIVVCTKFDAWSSLLGPLATPWRYSKNYGRHVLNLEEVDRVSVMLKKPVAFLLSRDTRGSSVHL